MRAILLTVLVASGCVIDDGRFSEDLDVDSGSAEADSCLNVSPRVLTVPGPDDPGGFVVGNACPEDIPIGFQIDADEGVFEVRTADESGVMQAGATLEVEVWLIAPEPGSYEGQILVSDSFQATTVQISGQVPSADE